MYMDWGEIRLVNQFTVALCGLLNLAYLKCLAKVDLDSFTRNVHHALFREILPLLKLVGIDVL